MQAAEVMLALVPACTVASAAPTKPPVCASYHPVTARVTASELRFCVPAPYGAGADPCWSFDGKAFAPIAASAVDAGGGEPLVTAAHFADGPYVVEGAWKSKVDDKGVRVCNGADCHAIVQATDVVAAIASLDGTRVAVTRGTEHRKLVIELYDIDGKRTGSHELGKCGQLHAFAGDLAMVGMWCSNEIGGDRALFAPDGAMVPLVGHHYTNEPFGSLGHGRWAFVGADPPRIHVYDVPARDHVDGLAIPAHDDNRPDTLAFAADRMYAFGQLGTLTIYDGSLTPIATAHVPACLPPTSTSRP